MSISVYPIYPAMDNGWPDLDHGASVAIAQKATGLEICIPAADGELLKVAEIIPVRDGDVTRLIIKVEGFLDGAVILVGGKDFFDGEITLGVRDHGEENPAE